MKAFLTFLLSFIFISVSFAQVPKNWKYTQSKDKMSGLTSKSLTSKSLNAIHLSFPYQGINYGHLKIEENGSVNVILELDRGQLNKYEEMSIDVKFDGDPDETYVCSVGDAGDKYLMIKDAKRFIERLATAKKIMIEPDVYKDGGQILYFNVTGFDIKRFNMDLASNW